MNIKNIFLIGLLLLSFLSPTTATPTTFDPPSISEIESDKSHFGKFKQWKQKKKQLVQNILIKEFISEDLTKIHQMEGCEKVTFNNREVYEVDIISMDDLKLVYKLCRENDGEEKVISLSEVTSIYSSEGDLIYKSGSSSKDESKILTLSILSLVSALIALLFPIGLLFGPLAIVMGAIALRKIKRRANGDKSNRGLALGGLISGIVISFLTLVILVLLLSIGWW